MQKSSRIAVKSADGKAVEIKTWFDATPYETLDKAIEDIKIAIKKNPCKPVEIEKQGATLLISCPIEVGSHHVVVPPNITLQFLQGGRLLFKTGTYKVTQKTLDKLATLPYYNNLLKKYEEYNKQNVLDPLLNKEFNTKKTFKQEIKKALEALNKALAGAGKPILPPDYIDPYEHLILIYSQQILEINGEIQAGFHQIFEGDGIITGVLRNEHVLPQWFGVVGDGKDKSAALQRALDTCAATGKTLYFSQDLSITGNKNLFVYGAFDLVGENTNAEIILDAPLDTLSTICKDENGQPIQPLNKACVQPHDGRHYWINFGIPAKGTYPVTYTGTVTNLQFRTTENAQVRRLLNFHNAVRFIVSGCYFDVRAMKNLPDKLHIYEPFGNNAGPITGVNNNAYCKAGLREYGRLLNNTCLAAQGKWGSEGIGMTSATDIIIEGNYIHGFADEAIGCAFVKKLTIAHNHCYTTDGSIKFIQCWDTRIIGNYHERIKMAPYVKKNKEIVKENKKRKEDNLPLLPLLEEWTGTGELIKGQLENIFLETTARVVISDNQLYIPKGVKGDKPGEGDTFGIRLMGVRDAIISNNQIRCDSKEASKGAGILIQANTFASKWTDPTGLDPKGVARPRNIHITGNTCYGEHPQGIEQKLESDTITIKADPKNIFEPKDVTILLGQTVRWKNIKGHNVNGSQIHYPGNPESFSSGIASGNTWDFTFDKPGFYNYHCDYHSSLGKEGAISVVDGIHLPQTRTGMVGTITVLDGLPGPYYVHGNAAAHYLWKYNTHFGYNRVVPGFLFNVEIDKDTQLENGYFPKELLNKFINESISLCDDVSMIMQIKGREWLIHDQGQTFTVIRPIDKENQTVKSLLKVYGMKSNPMKLNGDLALENRLLFEAYCTKLKPRKKKKKRKKWKGYAFRQGGTISRFYIERPTRITYVDITLDREISLTSKGEWAIEVEFWKNGKKSGNFSPTINRIDKNHKRVFLPWEGEATDFATCNPCDYIEIRLRAHDDLQIKEMLKFTNEVNAVLAVYGISW